MTHPFHLCLPQIETLNPETLEFGTFGGIEVDLEYSLYTISIWESKWKKPFIETSEKFTREEMIGFYEAMCITPNIDKVMWGLLTPTIEKDIFQYVGDPMSATKIRKRNDHPKRRETITSEIIYYWMSSLNIPYSCDRWHLNRLLKLIEIGFIKQSGPSKKKTSKTELARRYQEINAQRRAMYNTKG